MLKLAKIGIFFLITFLSWNLYAAETSTVNYTKMDLHCMTQVIYMESKSEPEQGQIAVGTVILNRVDHPEFKPTICGVVHQKTANGCQFYSLCNKTPIQKINWKQWADCEQIAKRVLYLGERVGILEKSRAIYFHATYVQPNWVRMKRVMKIGGHIFYSEKK